jgi:hypothetical protein
MSTLAALLAANPEAATKLIADHRDDGTGHCRVCRIGGQAGFQTWPCPIFCVAEAAVALIRARRG